MDYQPQQNDPSLIENLLRQKRLDSSFGDAGIPPREPDVLHHHVFVPPVQQSTPAQPQGQLDPAQASAVEPDNQTGVAPGEGVRYQDPVPKVGPINPMSQHPAESAYLQAIQNEPMHGDYHPSGLRKFSGVMGGIGAGIVSRDHVGGGMAADSAIVNGPFNQKHADWKQFATNKGVLATEEAAQTTNTDKEALNQSTIAKNTAEAENFHHTAQTYHPTNQGMFQDDERAKLASNLAGKNIFQVELKDHSKVMAIQDPATGILYRQDPTKLGNRGAILPPDSYLDKSDEGKMIGHKNVNENPFNAYMEGILNKDPSTPKDKIARDWIAENLKEGSKNKQEFDTFYQGYTKSHPNASEDQIVAAYAALPRPIPGSMMFSQQEDGTYKPLPARAGGPNLPEDVQTAAGVNTENTATAPTRTMRETAPKVIDLANKVLKQIEGQEKSLGPAAGRWSEFMAGKVGAPNAEFTALRTNVALLQTLLMRMHVGASGRVALMAHFKDLFDLGKQDSVNMKAAVGEIIDYAKHLDQGKKGSSGQISPDEMKAIDAEVKRRGLGKK